MVQILLIHNHLSYSPVTWLSLLIRIFDSSAENHGAKLKEGVVHEMVGSSLWWVIKKKLGFKVSYEANKGSGYKTTPYKKWLKSANRIVWVYNSTVELQETEMKEGYGYIDLWQIFKYIIKTRWLGEDYTWDGEAGCRVWTGMFCTEYIGRELGRKDAHLLTPRGLSNIPELQFVEKFRTYKQ